MPAPRLVIVADPKTLSALASGLREGGRFDVTAIPLSDPAGAQAAADKADAVAVFYGAAGAPVTGALQALAPRVRQRGGRLVAVLQREQSAQRDDCFRAGASDILYMPMPREQFVTRLQASVGLSWPGDAGAAAPVAVATRSAATKIDQAKVSAAGVEAAGNLPLKPGETVRLSWGSFQSWGLVVRGAPSAQIRFAGLAPEEETRIRDWVKSANGVAKPAAAAQPAKPAAAPAPAAAAARTAPSPVPAARNAPVAGPPPGFAERRPARDSAAPAAAVKSQPTLAASLFDTDAAPSAPAPAPAPDVPSGPPWPTPIAAAVARNAALAVLGDRDVPADTPANVAASAKKIAGMLSPGERAAIQRGGADSHFSDAAAARVALDAAASEGLKLSAAGQGASVDPGAVSAITKIADEAAARLQKEANAAIGKGEVESLQLITAASASLSRDLLNFKETADRLRGLGAAPRLGAGALDPDVVLPGQQPRPKPPPGPQAPAPVKPELREFQAFDQKPGRGKKVVATIIGIGLVVALANALYFGAPRISQVSIDNAGPGVERLDVSGESAMVTVRADWPTTGGVNLQPLVSVLRSRGVKRALIMQSGGRMLGTLDVAAGTVALVKPAEPKQ